MSCLSILHVLAPGAAGGLESVVRSLAMGQRDRGHAVRVAAVVNDDAGGHPFVTSLSDAGIDAHALAVPTRAYRREQALVAELCRRLRPAVVHTHGFRPDVVDAAVARRLGIPTITTVHGFTGGGWKVSLYELLQRRALRRFDAVAVVSHSLARTLSASGVPRTRIHVVPNAYMRPVRPLDRAAARRRLSVAEDRFVVGWVGRLSPEKGADTLLEAVARLPKLPLTVAVLGDGPERPALMRRAATLGLVDRVTWHGLVPDAPSLFGAFDVFVLSSRTEGVPIVLFEAMAAGVPIVATCVGGVPDVVSSTEASLVSPNDPAAIATAVLELYRHRETAASYARAARQRVMTEFQPEPWLSRYETLYRQIQKAAEEGRP